MKIFTALAFLAPAAFALAACDPHVPSPRQYVTEMTLVSIAPKRLLGTWYEVATYPAPWQDGCTNTTATYSDAGDGTLGVTNRCRRDGRTVQITGTATPVGPGQFKVRLEGVPFAGDYWVVGVSKDGRTVLVGTPSRLAGWVLHRDRHFTREQRVWAAKVFRDNGYDEAALQQTDQR